MFLRQRRLSIDSQDLIGLTANAGSGYRIESQDGQTALLEGQFVMATLGLGIPLKIHATDTLELHSTCTSIVLPPALTVSLLLDGELNASLDGMRLALTAQHGACGHVWSHWQPARLERLTKAGQRVRKVNISLPIEQFSELHAQLNNQDPAAGDALRLLFEGDGLTLRRWSPSKQSLRRAENMLAIGQGSGVLDQLAQSVNALTIVHEALSQLSEISPPSVTRSLGGRDVFRARQVRRYILRHIGSELRLDTVARNTGMSVSTLQRVFKACFGITVVEFIRSQRLEIARRLLCQSEMTVGEAAYQAGYANGANFATAFQREFGYPPSHCLKNRL